MFIVPFPISPESPRQQPWRRPSPFIPFRTVPDTDIDDKVRRDVKDAFRRAEQPVVRTATQPSAPETSAPQPAGFLSALTHRLDDLAVRTESIEDRLTDFNDRVHGISPENSHVAEAATASVSTTQVLNGVVNRVETALANIEEQLIRLGSLA